MRNVSFGIALFMRYMFLLVILISLCGFIIEIFEYYKLFGISGVSIGIFTLGVYAVCVSPIISTIIYIGVNVYNKSFKGAVIGLCLISAIIISFFIKSGV